MLGPFPHTIKSGLLLSSLLTLGSLFAGSASAAVIAEHVGDHDPAGGSDTTLWTDNSIGTTSVGPVTGPPAAWNVTDPPGSNLRYYSVTPTTEQHQEADANGWELTMNVRVNGVEDPVDFSVFAEYADPITLKRWIMTFGTDADGDPIVKVNDQADNRTFTVEGAGNTFNLYEMIKDPTDGTVDLFVNGVERISNILGRGGNSSLSRVVWGAGDTAGTGNADYAMVRFETIPEPATAALFGLSLLALSTRRRALRR